MTPDATEPKWSLRLPADCSIAAIRGVYDMIREAFGRQDRLEIDCSSVDKADVTSIQLLLSAAKTGEADTQTRFVICRRHFFRPVKFGFRFSMNARTPSA